MQRVRCKSGNSDSICPQEKTNKQKQKRGRRKKKKKKKQTKGEGAMSAKATFLLLLLSSLGAFRCCRPVSYIACVCIRVRVHKSAQISSAIHRRTAKRRQLVFFFSLFNTSTIPLCNTSNPSLPPKKKKKQLQQLGGGWGEKRTFSCTTSLTQIYRAAFHPPLG